MPKKTGNKGAVCVSDVYSSALKIYIQIRPGLVVYPVIEALSRPHLSLEISPTFLLALNGVQLQ